MIKKTLLWVVSMIRAMKQLLIILSIILIVSYLIGAFISMSLNLFQWQDYVRGIFILLWLGLWAVTIDKYIDNQR